MKKIENIIVLIILFFIFFGVFNAYAQDCISVDYEGNRAFFNELSETEPDEDNALTTWSTNALVTLTGINMLGVSEIYCGADNLQSSTHVPDSMKQGVISRLDDSMKTMFIATPSINVYAHLADEWVPGYDTSTSGVFAAPRSGYDTLLDTGIASVWSNVRNISYVFFVIIMLVAGFMIMFRHKIGGQTLVTLGNALPNVIISLILVTFSFAIAGIIIDMGGVVMVIIQDLLGLNDYVSTHNLWSLMSVFFSGTGRVLAIGGIGGVGLAATIIGIIGVVSASATNPIGWIALGSVGLIVSLLIGLIVLVVFVGSVLVLITLVKAYIGILFNVALAPLQLSMAAIPGNQAAIKNWFNSLFRNVLTFPVVFFIINLPLALAEFSGLSLGFPEKLVYVDSFSEIGGMDALTAIFIFLIQIIVFFYAAKAPKYLEAVFPPATPKELQEGLAAAKGSLAKLPLVGAVFK